MEIAFNKNEDVLKQQTYQLSNRLKKVYLGGGEKKIEAQHQNGLRCQATVGGATVGGGPAGV